jgi:GTP-binding protein
VKPAELASRVAEVEVALAKRPGAFPGILVTSGREGTGIPELRGAIARLLDERKR